MYFFCFIYVAKVPKSIYQQLEDDGLSCDETELAHQLETGSQKAQLQQPAAMLRRHAQVAQGS